MDTWFATYDSRSNPVDISMRRRRYTNPHNGASGGGTNSYNSSSGDGRTNFHNSSSGDGYTNSHNSSSSDGCINTNSNPTSSAHGYPTQD